MSEQTLTIGTPRRLPASPSGRLRSGRVIVAALVVLAVIAYLVYTGFQSTSVYYLTVSELKARGASQPFTAQVRVAGVVQENSVQRSTSDATLRFTMADDGGSLPVVYKGMVPDIFGPGIQVVVEGRYTSDGVFQASTLLAKCPSKFTAAVPTPAVSGPAR
jgi:cytochrome c-type biogenesis protein CcmE